MVPSRLGAGQGKRMESGRDTDSGTRGEKRTRRRARGNAQKWGLRRVPRGPAQDKKAEERGQKVSAGIWGGRGERGQKGFTGTWERRGIGWADGSRRRRLRPPAAPLTFPVVQGCGAQRGGGAGGGATPQQPGRGGTDRQQHREGGGGRRGRGRRHCCPARPPLPAAAGRPGRYHGNRRRCGAVAMETGGLLPSISPCLSVSLPPHPF